MRWKIFLGLDDADPEEFLEDAHGSGDDPENFGGAVDDARGSGDAPEVLEDLENLVRGAVEFLEDGSRLHAPG